MTEAQAVDRVHRIGQTRDVIVTRYIMRNSIEQVSKETTDSNISSESLHANRVIVHPMCPTGQTKAHQPVNRLT